MAKTRRVLVRHPAPNSTESLASYLLRLTEVNGYPSTHYMLADSRTYRPGESIDIQILAALTNRTARSLQPMALSSLDKKTGLLLGQPVSRIELNGMMAPICTRCVKEMGFIEAHFSLSLMTTCPVHRILLKVCPSCAKPLTWRRAGLLQCGCGQVFSRAEVQPVPAAVVELLEVMRANALSLPRPSQSSCGLPVGPLSSMSLRSLLFLIRSLGRRGAGESGKSQLSMAPERIVEHAAEWLSNWPINFRKKLDAMAKPASPTNPCKLTKGEFSGFYLSIMYGIKRREESAFMRDELVKYAVERFGVGTDDRDERVRILGDGHQYIMRSEMAARLGVDRRFANRILSKGSVETVRVESGGRRGRLLIDLSAFSIPSGAVGRIYNTDDAAAAIGIPRGVLVLLKELKFFEGRHCPPGIRGFHERDVEAYRARLLDSVKQSSSYFGEDNTLCLGQLLASGGMNMMKKAIVVSQIHSGHLQVATTAAKTVQEIRIPLQTISSLRHTSSLPDWRLLRGTRPNVCNPEGGISMGQAAREIGCDFAAIPNLALQGLLQRSPGNGCARWVYAASVDSFRATFQPLRLLAREIRSTPCMVKRICDEFGIGLLDIAPRSKHRILFIRHVDIPKVLSNYQQAKGLDRHTRLRWKRFAETKSIIGTRVLEVDKAGASEWAREDAAA